MNSKGEEKRGKKKKKKNGLARPLISFLHRKR